MLKLGCESWYAAGTMARGEGERVRDDGSLCEKVRHEARAEKRRDSWVEREESEESERERRTEGQREGKLTVVRSARLVARGDAGMSAETTQHNSALTEGRGATDAPSGRGGS